VKIRKSSGAPVDHMMEMIEKEAGDEQDAGDQFVFEEEMKVKQRKIDRWRIAKTRRSSRRKK